MSMISSNDMLGSEVANMPILDLLDVTLTLAPSAAYSGAGRPLHASEDQNLPSLLDHLTSGKQPDLGSSGSRTFSRKHHAFELSLPLSLALGSNLGRRRKQRVKMDVVKSVEVDC